MHWRLRRGARYLLPHDLVTSRYVPPLSPTWPDLKDWGRRTGYAGTGYLGQWGGIVDISKPLGG
jgi:hypothetical protein